MKIKRHKQFIKDFKKVQITDGQFEKFIQFSHCLKEEPDYVEFSASFINGNAQ